ncbi:lipoate-protein ligase B [Candidatus Regiella insecticola 5.15]|uniref:Octanoyltransferase n=2 Tax=Candidatus Regiella insecticola TaxID=138073 RepID=G2GZS8_9ENTR|nr:lipoate-protein ligase B [Candidatus Regiella insecticola 5.15]
MNAMSTCSPPEHIILRQLGLKPYHLVWQAMHDLTEQRKPTTLDEIWLVQHPAIFTQGKAGKAEHLLAPGDIPVFQSDRGGQITYHGPGQQVMYLMIDLNRLKISPRQLVTAMEKTVIQTLACFGIIAYADAKAPGIYVQQQKICSLGLRIRKGCSLHGLALNVAMDLAPFSSINPCGYANMKMTQVSALVSNPITLEEIQPILVDKFIQQFGYSKVDLQYTLRL